MHEQTKLSLLAQSLYHQLTASTGCTFSSAALPAPLTGATLRQLLHPVLKEGVIVRRGYIHTADGCTSLIEGMLIESSPTERDGLAFAAAESVTGILQVLDQPEQVAAFVAAVRIWREAGGQGPAIGLVQAESSEGKGYLEALVAASGSRILDGICIGRQSLIRPDTALNSWEWGEWTPSSAESCPGYEQLLSHFIAHKTTDELGEPTGVSPADYTVRGSATITDPSAKESPLSNKPNEPEVIPSGQAATATATATAPEPTPPPRVRKNKQPNIQPEIFTPDQEGYYPLHRAVMAKDLHKVSALLDQGAITEVKDKEGFTPLHAAVQISHLSIVERLLIAGANPNNRTYLAATPLHLAVELEEASLIALLLQYGAEIEARNNRGKSPLHLAAANGCLSCATTLVEKGANLAATMERDMQPLHLAAWYGQQALSTYLIQQGADINATNADGNSALHFAAFNGQVKLIKVLINLGADMFQENQSGETYLQGINAGYQGEMIAVLA